MICKQSLHDLAEAMICQLRCHDLQNRVLHCGRIYMRESNALPYTLIRHFVTPSSRGGRQESRRGDYQSPAVNNPSVTS